MAITHTLNWTYSAAGLTTTASATVESEAEYNLDVALTNPSDALVAFELDYSQCKAFFLLSDVDCTVETNAANHAGGQQFDLKAGVPVAWMYGMGTCPVTADITALYVTGTGDVNLTIRSLSDATV